MSLRNLAASFTAPAVLGAAVLFAAPAPAAPPAPGSATAQTAATADSVYQRKGYHVSAHNLSLTVNLDDARTSDGQTVRGGSVQLSVPKAEVEKAGSDKLPDSYEVKRVLNESWKRTVGGMKAADLQHFQSKTSITRGFDTALDNLTRNAIRFRLSGLNYQAPPPPKNRMAPA
jgi:hypothetical protein